VRVLHVAPFYPPAPARGGMARAAEGLCRALAAAGHEVTVFTAASDVASEDLRNGVRVRRFAGPRWAAERLVPFGRGIAAAIGAEAGRFDLAHLHGHRSGIVRQAAAALRRAGIAWVLQPHGTFPHHGQRRVAKALWDAAGGMEALAQARRLLALSDAEVRDLPKAPRSIVVGSGVTSLGVTSGHAAGRGQRVVFVGSEAPQKKAAALIPLLRGLPDAALDLVGPITARFVAGFGADAARVVRHGPLDDLALASVLESAAVLVHPAVGEAFGMAPFEACLAGTPAVVAGGHGCGEWFARAGGCVVPPDDPAALLGAVGERLRNEDRRTAEAAAVAAFARRELTWPQVAVRVGSIYDAVASGRAARAVLAG